MFWCSCLFYILFNIVLYVIIFYQLLFFFIIFSTRFLFSPQFTIKNPSTYWKYLVISALLLFMLKKKHWIQSLIMKLKESFKYVIKVCQNYNLNRNIYLYLVKTLIFKQIYSNIRFQFFTYHLPLTSSSKITQPNKSTVIDYDTRQNIQK